MTRESPRWAWTPALALTATLFAVAGEVAAARQFSTLEAERRSATEAGRAAAAVAEALDSTLAEARAGVSTGAQYSDLVAAVTAGVSARAVIRARDTGDPILDDAAGGEVVTATYETSGVPRTVADRRRLLSGFRVVDLDLASELDRLRPRDGGLLLSGPEQPVRSAPAGARPSDVASTVQLAPGRSPGWTLTAWTDPHTPGWLWWLPSGTVLVGCAGVGVAARREARIRRTRTDLIRLKRTSAEVTELTRTAQQSLDLAQVLPAVTTQLCEALDLLGLSLGTPTPDGERRFYVWGESPPTDVKAGLVPADGPAMRPLAVSLNRAGRSVAVLRVLPGRDLDGEDLVVLGAAAEALTSSLMNAEALAQQREQVARMRSIDELKTVFLATASHELRTPVAAISGFTEILTSRWDALPPESARRYVDRIHTSASHLSGLVEDLLDFSRIENGTALATQGTVLDLGAEVTRILNEHGHLAADHTLSVDVTPGLTIDGSPHALERIVTNLVGNAAKYSPAGSSIRVRVRPLGDEVQLTVEDQGPGIPAGEREQVFSRFFRGKDESVVSTRGAGLGLAIVREFTSALGGRVSVATAPGGGAAFEVTFPRISSAERHPRGETDAQA